MHPDLVTLLDLQTRDLALLDVDLRLRGVIAEAAVLDEALRQVQDAAGAARRAAIDAARRRDELEAKIESYRGLQERRRQKLEYIRNPKESATLMAELDLARSVLVKEESEWIRAAEGVAALEAEVANAEGRIGELQAAQEDQRTSLTERQAALEREREEALRARAAAAARVKHPLKTRYDKLRTTKSSQVVVALSGDACGACFTAVPRNRRSQIKTGLLIEGCEACGVILYSSEQSG